MSDQPQVLSTLAAVPTMTLTVVEYFKLIRRLRLGGGEFQERRESLDGWPLGSNRIDRKRGVGENIIFLADYVP